MGKLKNFWSSVGAFFSKAFSFIVDVLAMPAEPTWTKDSSYALIVCNDYKNDTHPVQTRKWMEKIFSECASTVDVVVDEEATCQKVLEMMEKGVKYKTFFFYIFCHGGTRSLFLNRRTLLAKDIWQVLAKSEGRIVGIFDACYSGSMLEDPNGVIRDLDDEEDDGTNIADAIVELFKENEFKTRDNGDVESLPKTRLRLYSAASRDTQSLYMPKQYSLYTKALNKVYSETDDKTSYREFDEKLVKDGTLHVLNNPNYEWIVPQVATYGEDFSSYPRFR